jgi:hypothetical protein
MTEPADPTLDSLEICEALDAAVRSLATGVGSIQERLGLAAAILLGRVSPADFCEEEEREVAEMIELALDRLSATSRHDTTGVAMSDGAASRAAADVVDLRDMCVGRAIRENENKHRQAHPRAGGRPRAPRNGRGR